MENPPSEDTTLSKAYEPNRFLRWLYVRFFSHISVDEKWSHSVEEAARSGIPVYVMRSLSFLDFLCLDFLTKRFGLPLIRFVNDLGLWILEPFGKGRRRLRLRRQIPEEQALRETLAERGSALLFLRRPPRFGTARRHGEQLEVDLIRTLIEAQREIETPIMLVPQTFMWSKLPTARERTWWDLLFGPREWPGRLRVFVQFLRNYRNALLRSGEPFNLKEFLERNKDVPCERVADRVRYALLTRIERERTLVAGPEWKSPNRINDEILRSPRMRPLIEAESARSGKTIAETETYARKELRRLCATQDINVVRMIQIALGMLWTRIYDGIEVDQAGVERMREAARRGPLVLLPSHKSHIDYLVLSYVLFSNDISPPLIAAGDNLSFWPLGAVLRRGGGFFIRRSFKGRKLYAGLVAAYLRKVISERFNLEFFLEGGRSRTGKLLPPKFGLLSMVVEAGLHLPNRPLQFVPISVGYERIIEARSYVDELTGGEKQPENIGGLLRTPKVLRSKYGRLYVQFGDIIDFDRTRQEVRAHGDVRSIGPAKKRALVQRVAHQVVHQINRATVVTPASLVATALLCGDRGTQNKAAVFERTEALIEALRDMGARCGKSLLSETGQLRKETVEEAIRLFEDGRLVEDDGNLENPVLDVPDERRIALEYYKNNIIHFFVSEALIAVAVAEHAAEGVTLEQVKARVVGFSRLFKYEFMFRADATFDEIFRDAVAGMIRRNEVVETDGTVRPGEGAGAVRSQIYVDTIRTYFESYRLALRGAELLVETSMTRKEWLKRTLAIGQRMYLAGELERRESVSKPRLENALRALHDMHVVHLDGEQIERGHDMADAKAVRDVGTQVLAFTT